MDSKQGVVISVSRNTCLVDGIGHDQPISCNLRKKLAVKNRRVTHPVAVGDHVVYSLAGYEGGVIEKILERRNKFSRPSVKSSYKEQVVVSNLDQIVIVVAVKDNTIQYGAIDRFICAGENAELLTILCINKMDLGDSDKIRIESRHYQEMGYTVLYTSNVTNVGTEALRSVLQGKTSAFCGPSGVGKSTLLGTLEPGLKMKTGEVNPKTQSGRHVTSAVRLLKLSGGGYVVDTPGIKEIGLWNLDSKDLGRLFVDFQSLEEGCHYRSCLHLTEPDCAIREALARGEIHTERYASYKRILQSLHLEENETI